MFETVRKYFHSELFRIYRKTQISLHDLTYLFWECTLRCNLSCRHCGSDCTSSASIPDMPLGDFLAVIDSLDGKVIPNKTMIVLSGGEPLMRKDLEKCGESFLDRGFPWGFVTNGYYLTGERLNTLLANGLCSATVSLDGLEGSHNWMRGRSDSFKKAVDAIGFLSKSSIKIFDVVTCINKKNIHELEQIYQLLVSSGVKRWRIFPVFPKGRAEKESAFELSPEMLNRLIEFIIDADSRGKIQTQFSCEAYLGKYEGIARKSHFFCRAGINVGSVLADGSISACPSLRGDYIQGNIYKDDFFTVWETKFSVMRDRAWMKNGICKNCKQFKYCGGNGLHLRDEKTGKLLRCHFNMINNV